MNLDKDIDKLQEIFDDKLVPKMELTATIRGVPGIIHLRVRNVEEAMQIIKEKCEDETFPYNWEGISDKIVFQKIEWYEVE